VRFAATRWSVILAAGADEENPGLARAALAELCRIYWAPLYGFIRSRGYPVHDAQDLTQEFFARLIERRIYTQVDQGKGKFRSFLLTSLKNFLTDTYHHKRRLKRGGAYEFLPLPAADAESAETLFQDGAAPGTMVSEDRFFERQWTEALLSTGLTRLAAEYELEGKGHLFQALEVFLVSSAHPLPTHDQLAARLTMPAATVRSHVTRLRARYRSALRAEVRRTVDTEEEVDAELRELLRILTAS
jgi:RNA polymerase sigma factor (sigma-70 family)